MSKIYSVAELQDLDTEELQEILEEYIDQADDTEFDYMYVKRITDLIVERDPNPAFAEEAKQAHDIFWREYADTSPLFEDIINEIKAHTKQK